MKYVDYLFIIIGVAYLIFSLFVDTSDFPIFGGFGMLMMIYSWMNINERYRDKSKEEAQKVECWIRIPNKSWWKMEMHPLIRIVWIILIGIILVSIRSILNEKGWKIDNFIRIEDDGKDNKNE